jgi:glycosyltransferase involved in cell wall biosynthesis
VNARDVTVVIPHIPIRPNKLVRAVKSVAVQTQRADNIIVVTDIDRNGSAITRNDALDRVTTRWVAFLDDDDWLYPNHLDTLLKHADATGADVVYPGCHVINPLGKPIPLKEEWGRFGQDFDADILRDHSYIPVTSLVRTQLAKLARFGPPDHDPTSHYDDWGFYLRILECGALFSHVPEITWVWDHHGKNTSGQVDRW